MRPLRARGTGAFATAFVASACVSASACEPHRRPRAASDAAPSLAPERERRPGFCGGGTAETRAGRLEASSCRFGRREIAAWSSVVPRDAPPAARCPMRVRILDDRVTAEALTFASTFDLLPWDECIPDELLLGARRVIRVDDGFLVARAGAFASDVVWISEDGSERRSISSARIAGFARSMAGAVLAIGIGPARLGRGGVLRFVHASRGAWSVELAAVLPVTPSPIAFDDGGAIVGYAQRFVFRAGADGRVENVHYVSRDLGAVTSIARARDGTYYLGVECGVLMVTPAHEERFWSARDGASGRWSECPGG